MTSKTGRIIEKRQPEKSVIRSHAILELGSAIHCKLAKMGDLKNKAALQRYFRGVVEFHGIKTPDLNSAYKELTQQIEKLTTPERIELARCLLSSSFAEEKGVAVRILHSLRKELSVEFLIQFETEFRTHVYDWGTADSLSSKVFRHLIEIGNERAIRRIVSWRNDSSLWMQRMAAVSFVCLARHGRVTTEVLSICSSTIKNSERFTQLGTGWVLRELWLAEPQRVENFIRANYPSFSREGLRYAIEKMPKRKREHFLNFTTISS
ncbi:DNA alkylation repair protein [bacterium]|nr:DNA alkylation repair protein [bacterium]